ncbi:MAG: Rpn family recombination-promoting nuclease/putative transposase [Bacteroidales bacterium]|nr:Rpn family recombination-promoting nuclease/putative transposase [Prevotella sp.]MDD6750798.1 Rpn family recombination-promoting nuclease/putative transposase [Bacteroidales bacterium]
MNYFQAKQTIEDRVFVDLLSDSGFKAVYADPANKSLLINLLNNVLPDDVRVSDIVEYRDREQQADTVFSKKTILDLVCRDKVGNTFGIEVQKKVDKEFAKRCIYYASGQYHSQLHRGGSYSELSPVYELAFLKEKYPHKDESMWDSGHIVSHYQLTEKRTGESLVPTIIIIFAELGRFTKSAEDCVTIRDKLFYWFKHAGDEKKSSLWREDPEMQALITATEIAAFPAEKKDIYIKDVMNEMDIEYQKGICYKEGLEQGREEGARETAIKTARAFLKKGISADVVSSCTGLTIEELKSISL